MRQKGWVAAMDGSNQFLDKKITEAKEHKQVVLQEKRNDFSLLSREKPGASSNENAQSVPNDYVQAVANIASNMPAQYKDSIKAPLVEQKKDVELLKEESETIDLLDTFLALKNTALSDYEEQAKECDAKIDQLQTIAMKTLTHMSELQGDLEHAQGAATMQLNEQILNLEEMISKTLQMAEVELENKVLILSKITAVNELAVFEQAAEIATSLAELETDLSKLPREERTEEKLALRKQHILAGLARLEEFDQMVNISFSAVTDSYFTTLRTLASAAKAERKKYLPTEELLGSLNAEQILGLKTEMPIDDIAKMGEILRGNDMERIMQVLVAYEAFYSLMDKNHIPYNGWHRHTLFVTHVGGVISNILSDKKRRKEALVALYKLQNGLFLNQLGLSDQAMDLVKTSMMQHGCDRILKEQILPWLERMEIKDYKDLMREASDEALGLRRVEKA